MWRTITSNLLETKLGRLTTFFFLYMAEGIPHGFAQTAVTSQMGLQGISAAQIGWFSGIITMPWAFKWAVGPVVDLYHTKRLGRRQGWIAMMQIFMTYTVLASSMINFSAHMMLFTGLMITLNAFSATQDVAIDALACGILRDDERGTANGLMFGGSYLGATVGGSGALLVMPLIGYQATFGLVALSLVAILLCFTMRLRESPGTTREASAESRLRVAVREIGAYSREAFRAFFGSRAAAVGVIVAVLPIGAMGISLSPINAKLAVDLGFKEADLASYNFVTGIIATVTCMAGGWLSDFVGRRRFIAVCVIGTSAMTLVLGWILQSNGWIMPLVKPGDAAVPPNLVWWFWAVSIAFSVFQGLMYGVRTALFMDICTPAVAATQFTAYMALLNVVISYSAVWQGKCVASMGYPVMLLIDALTGAICVFLLPLMKKAGDAMPKDAPHGSAS